MTSYFASDPTDLRLSVSAVVWRGEDPLACLLMRRSDNGMWGLPGGYVELGESVAEATVREIEEETGHRVEVERLVGVYSDPARQVVEYAPGERVQVINLCFQATSVGQGEPTTPEETLDMGFFACDELPEPFVPIHEIRLKDAVSALAGGGPDVPIR